MEKANGLQLSSRYFRDTVLPFLQEQYPELLPLLAAGLVGEGSDCFGFDDQKSRDHDWGPAICLWVNDSRLLPETQRILKELPEQFLGFPVRKGDARTGAFTVSEFYTRLIGRADAPKSNAEWLSVPESALAAAVNGIVFLDGPGQFTEIRRKLEAYYPEPVRLRLLAQQSALAAQTGQYNYLRCADRGDFPASSVILGRFLESTAALVFLLNRKYRPFYKWTFRAMCDLPILGAEIYADMERLSASQPGESVFQVMEQICARIIQELKNQNLTGSDSNFLMDHCGEILSRISDENLKRQPVSLVIY